MSNLQRVPRVGGHKPLSDDDALRGAAYRVVFQRAGDPRRCGDENELAMMGEVVRQIREWSRTLENKAEAHAYERAAVALLEEAKTAAANSVRARRMISLYSTITKPPETIRVPPVDAASD